MKAIVLLKGLFKAGTIHLLTQAIALLVLTKGTALYLILSLAETNGWVMLGLWLVFNFIVIAFLASLLGSLTSDAFSHTFLITSFKVLVVALAGGFISYHFNIIYYRYHFYSIGKQFYLDGSAGAFKSFMTYVPPVITLGELIRKNPDLIQRIKLSFKKVLK